MNRRDFLAAGTVGLVALPVFGQTGYPNKPIRIIVGYSPGGASDILARLLAQKLSAELKQPVIVENHPGASGNIGTELAARAEPDGYTLMLGAAAQIAINPSLFKSMKVNPVTDLVPITQLQVEHNVMVVHAAVPARTLGEFIAYAKANPNKLSFSSAGTGAPGHLVSELLNVRENLKMAHVPYKGTGPSVNDVVAGHITMTMDSMVVLLPHLKAGKVRALAVLSDTRAEAAPNIPTYREAGRPDLACTSWKGLLAPRGTPEAVTSRLHRAVQLILADKEVRERLVAMGAEPLGSTPEQFASFIRAETVKWAEIVKVSGASLD